MGLKLDLGLGVNSGGGVRFTPKKISGLALWLDASDLSTITKDGSDYVSAWADKSGKGFNVAQGTGSAQPLWASNTISFDGSSDFLLSATGLALMKNKASGTMIVVGSIENPANTTAQFVYCSVTATAATRLGFTIGPTIGNSVRIGGRRIDTDSFDSTTAETITYGNTYIMTGISDYANAKAYLYLNNVLKQTDGSFQTAGNTSDTTSKNISIGADAAGTLFTKCILKEVLIYEKALTSTELTRVNQYLSRKWSVTI